MDIFSTLAGWGFMLDSLRAESEIRLKMVVQDFSWFGLFLLLRF
jgi:hypothetical protein